LSADGRFVAFSSAASNLVSNDTNNTADVFVRNLETGVTTLASINAAGTGSGNGSATFPYLSADGSVVGFRSAASDLTANDTNNLTDVFVRNLTTGTTTLVSVNSAGTASGNGQSVFSTISADGRIVAFTSNASNLAANDSNGTVADIFVRDLQAGVTTLVSATPAGTGSGNAQSSVPVVSANGRFVVFNSRATNLVTLGDNNGTDDVFVRDLAAGKTRLVSVDYEGTVAGARTSYLPSPQVISADGNFIAFVSQAFDLVGNDTNGTVSDVFVRDMAAGVTKLVSVNSAASGSGNSFSAANEVSISADGRFVTFDSVSTDLVAGTTAGQFQDIYVRDLLQSQTTLVSPNLQRTGGGNNNSFALTLSADGSTVVFISDATNLVAADTNNALDVFAYTLPRTSCTYTISPVNHTAQAGGESLSVSVTTQAGCLWTATTSSGFITINSGASGTGNGTVLLSVLSNGSGVPRVGTVTIAGQTLTITQPELIPDAPIVYFDRSDFQAGEGAGRATLYVNRGGTASGTVTVQYLTTDDPSPVPCSTRNGIAYARCDYATTIDTLTFAPGERVKEIYVPLVDDGHDESDERVQVRLRNATGAEIIAEQSSAILIISDNDQAGAPNPIFTTPFFVRQHYLDFLSREPEAGEPWSAILNACPDVNNLDPKSPSAKCDRLTVSLSLFGSPEFRLKGFFVYNFYRVAFDRLPEYQEIIIDMRRVSGATPEEVYARRAALAVSFTQRQEFKTAYDAMSNQQYVDALLNRYNLQSVTTPDPADPEGGGKVTLTRADLTNRLGQTGESALTRAQVLRAIVESDEVGVAEYNRAFVAMQYYGYLRRKPEEAGYNDWLRVINEDPNNVRVMVNGFMNSQEYRLRFGEQ
ncbi:MAG TPA: Calx-beta domain-containing protein, partial [Pyrinomonadaceae bacterium]|nr:Calx-beta domain-containing protein [Pyrinomonadaceae bacterium]